MVHQCMTRSTTTFWLLPLLLVDLATTDALLQRHSAAKRRKFRSSVRPLHALRLVPVDGAPAVDVSLERSRGDDDDPTPVGEGVVIFAKGGRYYCQAVAEGAAIRLAKEDNSRDLSIGIRYMLDPNSMSLTLPSGAAYDLVDDDADSKPPAKDPMMSMMFEAMKKSYPQTDDES